MELAIRAVCETNTSPTAKGMKTTLGAKNKSSVQWNTYIMKIIEKYAPGTKLFPWKYAIPRELTYPGQ